VSPRKAAAMSTEFSRHTGCSHTALGIAYGGAEAGMKPGIHKPRLRWLVSCFPLGLVGLGQDIRKRIALSVLPELLSKSVFTVLAALFLVLLSAQRVSAEERETVRLQLKWYHQFQFAGYYAAHHKGYYDSEGLDVVIQERQADKDQIEEVLSGEADYGVADSGLLLVRKQGKPVVLLKQIFQHSPQVFISLKASGIISPYEMADKKIMVDAATQDDSILVATLMDMLGSIDGIVEVPRSYGREIEALVSGEVDVIGGYMSNEPFTLQEKGVSANTINPQNYGIDFYGDNLFTTEEEIMNHPKRVDKMIRATLKGWEYAMDHPKEIIALILSDYTQKFTPEKLEFEAKVTELMVLPHLVPLGELNIGRLKRTAEIYQNLGMSTDDTIPEGYVYREAGAKKLLSLSPEELVWLNSHKDRDIRLAFDPNMEPLLIANPDGRVDGVMPELFRELDRLTGLRTVVKLGKWRTIIDEAKNREVDGLLACVPSLARDCQLLGTLSHHRTMPAVFARTDAPFEIHSMSDLAGKRVAKLRGVKLLEDVLESHRDDIVIVETESSLESLTSVLEGKTDVAIGLAGDNYTVIRNNLAGITPVFIDTENATAVVSGIRSDWPELASILDKALRALGEQRIKQISDKWMSIPQDPQLSILTPEEQRWLIEHPIIRVSCDPDSAPIQFLDKSGEYQGVAMDYLEQISKILGIRLELVGNDSWVEAIERLETREADLLANAVETPQRQAFARFTDPYLALPTVIFTSQDVGYVAGLDELKGKRVASVKGAAVSEFLRANYPDIELIELENIPEALSALESQDILAYVGNILVTSHYIREGGYGNLKVAGDTPFTDDVAIGVRSDWPELVGILQKAIDAIPDAHRTETYRKWVSVTYEHGFDYTRLWRVAAIAVILILVSLAFNLALKRQVGKRTAELRQANTDLSMQVMERVRAEKSSREMALFPELNPAPVLSFGPDGLLLSCNEAAQKIFGLTVGERISLALLPPCLSELDFEKCIAESQMVNHECQISENCYQFVFAGVPDPGLVHVYGSDITDRKRVENALRQSEEKYRTLFERSQDAVMTLAPPSWKFTSANQATMEMFGARDETHFTSLVSWEVSPETQPDEHPSAEKAREMIETAMREGSHFFKWTHKRVNGEEFPTTVLLSRMEWSGEPMLQATVRDITHEVQLEERLRQSHKMEAIGTLAGGIAHDFNNILGAILGYSELAMLNLPQGSDACKDLAEVMKAGHRAAELVRQILAFSRQTEQERTSTYLQLIIKEALTLLRGSLPSTIEIHENVDLHCRPVFADPTQIHQVLMNLCTNAYHAMEGDGGTLSVALQQTEVNAEYAEGYLDLSPGNYVCITVADTGQGMNEETRQRLFEPYFTTKSEGKGTGLGLAVVHGIVSGHNGVINVYGEPGEGTEFRIYLPVAQEPAATKSEVAQAPPHGAGEHILLVDDEEVLLNALNRQLERLGYRVSSFSSSEAALRSFSEDPMGFDLVITDATMPIMTGQALTKELRIIRENIPVILVTGLNNESARAKAGRAGIHTVLSKPVNLCELGEAVHSVMNEPGECRTT
jgi:PAS domain S-box-containing protein